MQKLIFILALLLPTFALHAQWGGPRLFWDIPSLYATSPNVSAIGERFGVGAETAFNLAAHWGTTRLGGGATFTLDPDDVENTFRAIPYFLLEGGAGLYRTNGNKCASTKSHAFTAMGVIGLRYEIDTRDLVPASEIDAYGLSWGVGAEFGYFFIRDVFRNTELVLRGMYYPEPQQLSVNFGFKFFLNVREWGGYY